MNAGNGVIYLEQGQAMVDFVALSDEGDRRTFSSADAVWSKRFEPEIRLDGLVTGTKLITASATNDVVDVAAATAFIGGEDVTIAADTATIGRPVTDVSLVNSITATSAGAIVVVEGVDGSDTSFSEVRGAAGGPPLIPVGSIELGQVRVTASAGGLVLASEIYQIAGQHTERSDFPDRSVSYLGKGVESTIDGQDAAHIYFATALPANHTGDIPRGVYLKYYTPVYGELSRTLDFTAAETTHSISSTQYYGGTVGSKSSSLGQGGFTALLSNGVTDGLVASKNQDLTVKFFPDRDRAQHIITQGTIGITRSFPVADEIQATVVVSAQEASVEFAA